LRVKPVTVANTAEGRSSSGPTHSWSSPLAAVRFRNPSLNRRREKLGSKMPPRPSGRRARRQKKRTMISPSQTRKLKQSIDL